VLLRRLKPTVNKVSSLRDAEGRRQAVERPEEFFDMLDLHALCKKKIMKAALNVNGLCRFANYVLYLQKNYAPGFVCPAA
jgi:hypothetical protein